MTSEKDELTQKKAERLYILGLVSVCSLPLHGVDDESDDGGGQRHAAQEDAVDGEDLRLRGRTQVGVLQCV